MVATTDNGLALLAFELSQRMVERQERVLDELRARTGTLLAASALAASFLGSRAVDGETGVFTALAVIAFASSVIAGTYVLLPKRGLVFALRGSVLYESEFQDAVDLNETHRRLAYWLERFYDQNQNDVERLFRFFRGGDAGRSTPGDTLDIRDRHLEAMAKRPAPAPPPPPPPNLGVPETRGFRETR